MGYYETGWGDAITQVRVRNRGSREESLGEITTAPALVGEGFEDERGQCDPKKNIARPAWFFPSRAVSLKNIKDKVLFGFIYTRGALTSGEKSSSGGLL